MKPTSMAGGLGSGVLLVWLLGLRGIEVPNEVAAILAGVLMPVAGWFGDLLSIVGAKVLAKVEGASK